MSTTDKTTLIARRFQPIMHDCRKMCLSYLAPAFMRFVENAELSLLEAADRAENNQIQTQYFAVMKALKQGKENLTQEFLGKLDREFRVFIERGAQNPEIIDVDHLTADKLRLVEKRETEMALPVQNIILRANSNFIEQLYGLEQRLAVVNGGNKVEPEALPGGVVQIAYAFRDVISLFDAERKLRLMLFVAFDRDVTRELSGYLDEYNRRLANAGILPNLRYATPGFTSSRSASRAAQPATTPQISNLAEEDEVINTGVFDEIRSSLHTYRGQVAGVGAVTSGGVRGSVTTSQVAESIDELKSEQTVAHPFDASMEGYFEDIHIDHSFIEELRQTLNAQIEHLFARLDRGKLEEADEDAIDLVGMLFDYMLQDEQVPNVVKVLLSRLQIPYLKVAINEKQLFIKKKHPARRLLDALVEAGTRWVIEDDLMRGIFPHLQTLVDRIHDDEILPVALFREALTDLQQHVAQLEEKSQQIQKRSIAAAEGQERLEMARNAARIVIQKTLRGRPVLQTPQDFFFQDWAEKMVFILLRDEAGRDSKAWRTAMDTLELMISLAEIPADEAHRQSLEESFPIYCEKIAFRLDQLRPYGRKDNDKMLEAVAEWHVQALAALETSDAQSLPDVAATVEEVITPDLTAESELNDLPITQERKEELIRQLESVPFGTWFEFQHEEGQGNRLRLAWYSKASRRFMFVDALGLKAAEYSLPVLVEKLDKSRVRVLSLGSKPFFDRALEAIRVLLGRRHTA